jgi:hypothetical protein
MHFICIIHTNYPFVDCFFLLQRQTTSFLSIVKPLLLLSKLQSSKFLLLESRYNTILHLVACLLLVTFELT